MNNIKLKRLRRRKVALISIIICCLSAIKSQASRKQRRWWVKPWIARRSYKGNLHLVNKELATEDPESYKNFLRMNEYTFNKLLKLIQHKISRQNTNMRECISAKDKLIITLRFLATGESYRSLMYSFRVSESTISLFIPDVCHAIYSCLKDEYLKVPSTAAEWLTISREFEERWNLPNVIAAMDGKHIIFQAPRSAGSLYYNYKGTHSIVLLALVDADYNFIYVDVGTNGRVSDGGVFRQSSLSTAIEQNGLNLPEERALPGRNKLMPYVIVADAAFPLSSHIMKPFPYRNMTREQITFNYRLSRARNVVENAFGILANRFRILLTKINLSANKVQNITLACCTLHNFLKKENRENYITANPENEIDKRYTFKYALSQQSGNRPRTAALQIRQEFVEYVNGIGRI